MAEIAMFVSELAAMMCLKHDSHHHKCVACCLMCHVSSGLMSGQLNGCQHRCWRGPSGHQAHIQIGVLIKTLRPLVRILPTSPRWPDVGFGQGLPMFMLPTTHLFQFRFADTGNHNLSPPLTLINWWPSSLITLTFFWTDDNHVPVVPGRDIFMNEYKVLKIPVWSGFYVMAVLIFVTFVRAGSMASSALFAVKRERPAERSLCLMSGVPMRRIFRWVKRNLRSSSTRNVWEKIAERCWMSASPGLTA